MITRLRLWLRSVVHSRRLEREMQVEMAEHLDRSTQRLIGRGLSPEAARHEAMREFGNMAYLQEEGRIARGTAGVDTLIADLRFALRHFVRNPLSTLTIIAVLAIGIGINVVLFTVVDSFTERPPRGVEASDELVRLRGSQQGVGGRAERAFTLEEVEGYADLTTHYSEVAAWTSKPVSASAAGIDDFTITATFVTDGYFNVLGVRSVLGSDLAAGDGAPVALLSHATWTRSFGSDPGILGRTITINNLPVTIVGVAPPLFRGAAWEGWDDMQLWLPMSSHRRILPESASDEEIFRAIARLQPGITREAAAAASAVVAGRAQSMIDRPGDSDSAPLSRDVSTEVVPLLASNLEPDFEANARFVKLAFGVLGLLTLLVTSANVSALQTGLALARRREIAIRMSLGAKRARIVRQLVTENVLLAIIAGGAAIGVTVGIIRVLLAIVGSLSFELVLDRTTFFFTFAVALATGLLFGLSPALHATRTGIAGALKDSAGSIAGARAPLQRRLVVGQIALTQPLAVCVATLVLLGLLEFRERPANPFGEQIVLLRLASAGAPGSELTGDATAAQRARADTELLVQAFRETPGIAGAVEQANQVPVSRSAFIRRDAERIGAGDAEPFHLVGRAALPGYLELMGTKILLGRDLSTADTAGYGAAAIPALIGDDMARRLWGESNPIGHRVERAAGAGAPMTLEVVGVYEEVVDASGNSRDSFTIFLPPEPLPARRSPDSDIMLRIDIPAETAMPTIREIARSVAPTTAVVELRTLADVEDEQRFILWGGIGLISSGGVIVLLLSALGLYAVVSFAVRQRTGEIAVRMAIGARSGQIVRHFAADGLRLTALGIVLGLPLSVLGVWALMSLEPGVPEVSLTLVTTLVAGGVLGVSGLASWIPASRAADLDPAVVLRRE